MKKKITGKLVRKYFSDAEIKNKWFGPWRVTMRDGASVDIYPDEVKNISGGYELYRRVALLGDEVWGQITVTGSNDYLAAMLAAGESQGITVIPKTKPDGAGCLGFIAGCFGGMIGGAIVGQFLETFGFVIGCVCGFAFCWSAVQDWANRRAMREGQALRSKFAPVHGERREAVHDDVEREGWL